MHAKKAESADTLRDFVNALTEVEDEHGSVKLKYLLAFRTLTGTSLNSGALLYQDLGLLIKVRNKLAHIRPLDGLTYDIATNTQEFYPAEILKNLEGRCDFRHEKDTQTSWLNQLETADVAKWAVNATARIVNALGDSIPASEVELKRYTKVFRFRELT